MKTSPMLEKTVLEEYSQWRRGVIRYASAYFGSRLILIVASAIVAADRNLVDSDVSWLISLVPALSLLVAVLAAVDTWLRPQERWRGFMRSRDNAQDLLLRIEQGLPGEEALAEFNKIRTEHRENNIF